MSVGCSLNYSINYERIVTAPHWHFIVLLKECAFDRCIVHFVMLTLLLIAFYSLRPVPIKTVFRFNKKHISYCRMCWSEFRDVTPTSFFCFRFSREYREIIVNCFEGAFAVTRSCTCSAPWSAIWKRRRRCTSESNGLVRFLIDIWCASDAPISNLINRIIPGWC